MKTKKPEDWKPNGLHRGRTVRNLKARRARTRPSFLYLSFQRRIQIKNAGLFPSSLFSLSREYRAFVYDAALCICGRVLCGGFSFAFSRFLPRGTSKKKSETLKIFYSLVTVLKCVCVSDNLKMFKTACPFINTSLSVINFPFSLSSSRALHFSLSLSRHSLLIQRPGRVQTGRLHVGRRVPIRRRAGRVKLGQLRVVAKVFYDGPTLVGA